MFLVSFAVFFQSYILFISATNQRLLRIHNLHLYICTL